MTLAPGTQLGPYEIVAPLGAGGMGEIYRAKDTRLDREVAVKVLPEHLAKDHETLTRFEREAKAVAALSHPNILAIHDVGTEGETSYVVMELLEGETLRERVRRSPIPWRKAVEIGAAIADGLAAAHAKGIVHRDLKPENIFLTKDGVVKILDFGLARMESGSIGTPSEDQADTPTVTLDTRPGTVLGTVNYMSPEQVRGQKIDARSDIFSFGSVLYEMMTGSRAFTGESTPETMTAILKEEPPGVVSTRAEIIPEVDRVITRCVEKRPEHRIQSARDLAFALRDILMDSGPSKPVMATPTPKAARLSWILVGALAVALAVVLTLWQAGKLGGRRSEAITSLAVLPFVSAGGDSDTEYLSDEIPASIINNLARLSDLRVVPRNTAFRHKGQEKELATLGRELKVEAILTGRVAAFADSLVIHAELIDVANDKQLWGTKYRRTLADILAIEEDIAKHISDALRLRLTYEDKARLTERYTENAEAYRAYLQGRFWWNKRTREGFRKAIEFFDEAIRIDPTYALAYAGKADTYIIMGYYTHRPSEVAPLAHEAAEAAIRLDPMLAEAYPPLAWVHAMYNWDWEAAEEAYRKAIELNPRYATAHHWYGVLLLALGRFDEAEREIIRARQLDPGSLIISREYASVALFRRDFSLALRRCRHAVEMDPMFAPAHKILGDIYLSLKRYDEAIAEFRRLIELEGRAARYAGALGYTYGLAGRRAEALEELRILGELSAQGEYVPAGAIGMIHAGLGNFDAAFEWLDKACDERDNDLAFFKFAPNLDVLRTDPRFDALLKKMNLPPDPPAPVVPPRPAATSPASKIRLAVLPFENLSGDPGQEYFSDGLTVEAITELSQLAPEKLAVIGRTSSMHFKGSEATITEIGRQLSVDYVVQGAVRQAAGRVRVDVALIDVSDQTNRWMDRLDHELRDVLAVQTDVARWVAESLALELVPEVKAREVDPAAHAAYLRGRRHTWNVTPEDAAKAVASLRRSVSLDPGFAPAHAVLAHALWLDSIFSGRPGLLLEAKTAALRALSLAPDLAEAHAALGLISMVYDYDWNTAAQELQRSLELNPNSVEALIDYSIYLYAQRRFDEGLSANQRAAEVDPLNAVLRSNCGEDLAQMGRYEEAMREFQAALELDPDSRKAHHGLGIACELLGQYEDAIDAQSRWYQLSSEQTEAWREAYRSESPTGYWRWQLEFWRGKAREGQVNSVGIARLNARLGDRDAAIRWLEQAFEERRPEIVFINAFPAFDPLRDDPRFQALLRRMGFTQPAEATHSAAPTKTVLAVLPFEGLSLDSDTVYLKEEIPASIIDGLSNLTELRVIPRSTAFRCKIGDRDTASIGRDLNATAVLTGQINTRGNGLRIRAELVDVATNRQLWSERYDRTLTDILAIERDIAESISETLKLRLTGEERTQLVRRSTASPEAHRFYLEGRFWWNRRSREGYNKAIELFDEAIRLDPEYALAYAGKADCYCLMVLLDSPPKECIPKAREAAEQALAANGTLAEAHTSLGWIKWVYDWDWPGAERSFKRAIELNPRYPTAHNWYAGFLAAMGRDTEAIEQITRAHQLDPGSLIINRDLGVIYSWTGQIDRAIDQLRRTVQMDPLFAPAHAHLGRVYVDAGRYDEAITELEIAVDLTGHVTHGGMLGHAYARVGRRDDAERELEKLSEFAKQRNVPAFKFAVIHTGLGDKEQAFEWLEKAYENREFAMAILRVGQGFNSLRDDPRFDDLLRRIGLPP